ncbi:MAG: hypothetical protein EXR98_00845 [Gemmataceae bacterium]|nr:hypothetical protein [Gemmataceae bacterium]
MTLQQIHLRINDAATGQPTPVRLRITDAAGTYYAPYGRLTDFATGVNQDVGGNVQIGAKKWAYIDGTCEILLPPDTLHIEIAKGPEYKPIDEDVTLLAGKMSMRFTIERWSDVRKQGWNSGDTRVHFMSPDAALLEGQAEDVAVVNLLAAETDDRAIPNILSFSGQSFARSVPTCGVAVNTFNDSSYVGRLALLHCHRIVYPLSWRSAECDTEWTLADWCDQCHRKKGLVIWACPRGSLTADCDYGEPLADLVLGKIDAFEISPDDAGPHSALADYLQLCDAGLIVPLVGASVKSSNHSELGVMRTYAYIPPGQDCTYSNWIQAVRDGRTFISNGPVLQWTIDGAVIGARLVVSPEGKTVQIRAGAESLLPFDHLELLWNGQILATAAPTGRSPYRVELEHELVVRASGWLAARCTTDRTHGTDSLPLAHTSAVEVCVSESPRRAEPDAVKHFLSELDGMLRFASKIPLGGRLRRVVEEARTILAKKLSP